MAGARADQLFEEHRRQLTGLAYRMLGSAAEAEDAVQDAYLRWSSARAGAGADIETPRAYLTKIVVRICLDQLKSARRQRETYVGSWLPEPIITAGLAPPTQGHAGQADEADQARLVELAHDLSVGLMLMLERLSPLERAAFLLHDVFDMEWAGVADALASTPEACRQLATRARRHVRAGEPRFHPTPDDGRALMAAFAQAARSGDIAGLTAWLAEDAVLISDGGGRRHAPLRPIRGAQRIARFCVGVARRYARAPARLTVEQQTVNDLPGVLVFSADGLERTIAVDMARDRRIRAIYMVLNPDKLRGPRALVR